MEKPKFFIGIDISAETFDAAVFQENKPEITAKEPFTNNPDGYGLFCSWLASLNINNQNSAICMEITGSYSECICYYLHEKGFVVWAEAPHKVHRAFYRQVKNDEVSAIQIAEYIYRFFDKINPFRPNESIVEQIKTLLATREQLQKQATASQNILHSIKRKYYQTPLANDILAATIKNLKSSIDKIDKELNGLIKNNSKFAPVAKSLDSIPGIAMLFIANFIVITDGLTKHMEYKELASYIGICPNEHRSGTSVFKKPHSSGHGPYRLRKLLHLAAMSVRYYSPKYNNYFVLKQAQGKLDNLIINNIANKLLRIVCAISKNCLMYNKNYNSIHPRFLMQNA
jgi:transposase